MEGVVFQVKGSAEEPYVVTFAHDAGDLKASCTCPAGVYGNYCKHRIAILSGDSSAIVSENREEIAMVQDWLESSPLAQAMQELEDAERHFLNAKNLLKHAKRNVGKTMDS